jgi:hypothetical protein
MALDAKTSIEKIGARGQAMRLFYQSGAHVEIAPTFKWKGDGFALPRGDSSWMTTDPEAQASWFLQGERLANAMPASAGELVGSLTHPPLNHGSYWRGVRHRAGLG